MEIKFKKPGALFIKALVALWCVTLGDSPWESLGHAY